MISVKNVTLTYQVHHDRTSSIKEAVVNLLHRRKYVAQGSSFFNALDNVSFEVQDGERVGIIGRNGSGKSTMLKILSGILKPTAGDAIVEGTVQPLIEIAAGFNPEFSGRENIFLNGYMLGFTKEKIIASIPGIIDFSELHEFIDVPVKYYSSGMAVRLAFSIATSIDPEILIFDEMLSAGDASFIEKTKTRMNSLISKARQVIVVSHDLNFIREFSTRIIVLESGKIIFDGPPAEGVRFYLSTIHNRNKDSFTDSSMEKLSITYDPAAGSVLQFAGLIENSKPVKLKTCDINLKIEGQPPSRIKLLEEETLLSPGINKFSGSISFNLDLIISAEASAEIHVSYPDDGSEKTFYTQSISSRLKHAENLSLPSIDFNMTRTPANAT